MIDFKKSFRGKNKCMRRENYQSQHPLYNGLLVNVYYLYCTQVNISIRAAGKWFFGYMYKEQLRSPLLQPRTRVWGSEKRGEERFSWEIPIAGAGSLALWYHVALIGHRAVVSSFMAQWKATWEMITVSEWDVQHVTTPVGHATESLPGASASFPSHVIPWRMMGYKTQAQVRGVGGSVMHVVSTRHNYRNCTQPCLQRAESCNFGERGKGG